MKDDEIEFRGQVFTFSELKEIYNSLKIEMNDIEETFKRAGYEDF